MSLHGLTFSFYLSHYILFIASCFEWPQGFGQASPQKWGQPSGEEPGTKTALLHGCACAFVVLCCFLSLQYGKTAVEFAKAFAREMSVYLQHCVHALGYCAATTCDWGQRACSFCPNQCTLAISYMCTHTHTHARTHARTCTHTHIQEVVEVLEVAVNKHH